MSLALEPGRARSLYLLTPVVLKSPFSRPLDRRMRPRTCPRSCPGHIRRVGLWTLDARCRRGRSRRSSPTRHFATLSLSRYPQLYSRVGFVHQFRALSSVEVQFIIRQKAEELGITLSPEDVDDAEAIAAIARITNGNFQLLQRLFSQIQRIMEINHLTRITDEAVQAARESLVIGPT
jgi:hypothetical protein